MQSRSEIRKDTTLTRPVSATPPNRILNLHTLLGHSRQILQMDVGGMPHQTFLRSIELLGTEVLPTIRRALES